jgi:hypothetical protein
MEAKAQSLLIVAGIEYHLDRVLQLAKTMPPIEAKTADFLPFENAKTVEVKPADPNLNHGEIILFKREGKWIIITGRESVRRAVETGAAGFGARLLSAQALKRCKVDCFVHPDDGKPSVVAPPPYEAPPRDDYRNAPRIVDKRKPMSPTYDRPYSTPSVLTKDVAQHTKSPSHGFSGQHAKRASDPVQERARRIIDNGGIPAGKMDVVGAQQPREHITRTQFGPRKTRSTDR